MSVISDPKQSDSVASGGGLRLLVALPALNEEATIVQVVESIPLKIDGVSRVDVVVVDDGSTDRTAELARSAGAVVVHHMERRGVGAAFHTALAYAIEQQVALLVTIDSDGQFDPRDIPKITLPVIEGKADFVTASRFKDPALTPQMPWIKQWGNRQMSRLISRLTGHKFYDVSCGMRCYGRKALVNLNPLGTFTYTQEVFLNLAFKKLHIAEVPVRVRGEREFGESRVASNLWQYAVNSAKIIFRAYRDYHPMRLFGGVALILLVPALLMGGFLLVHYLATGTFTPYKWLGFSSAALAFLGLMMLHMGMIGDMLNRHRVYLEELLYNQRLRSSANSDVRIDATCSSDE